MKKTLKAVLVAAVSFVMLFALSCGFSFAANTVDIKGITYEYNKTAKTAKVIGLENFGGALEIPEKIIVDGEELTVNKIGTDVLALDTTKNMTSISFPKTLTDIIGIKGSINISDNVKKLVFNCENPPRCSTPGVFRKADEIYVPFGHLGDYKKAWGEDFAEGDFEKFKELPDPNDPDIVRKEKIAALREEYALKLAELSEVKLAVPEAEAAVEEAKAALEEAEAVFAEKTGKKAELEASLAKIEENLKALGEKIDKPETFTVKTAIVLLIMCAAVVFTAWRLLKKRNEKIIDN